MDLKRVEEMIELMRRSGVTQLSLELPDYKISITRGPGGPQPISDAAAEQPAAEEAPETVPEDTEALSVASPVVGVFHNGGMLDPRETVKEGDRVEKGQLIAAIEAMKVPNELRAPVSGMVSKLLVEDGAAVQYGQTLLLIHPDEDGADDDDESLVGLA